MDKSISRRITFENLKAFCKEVYMKVEVPDEEAEIIADFLAKSDLRGFETHGVMRLPIYIQRLQKGYVRAKCELTILKEKGPIAFWEAHGSIGHVVAYKAMKIAIQKAEEHGIGWVSVKDSGHFGVAGLFSMMALKKDFIGCVASNSAPTMAPYGGRERIMGNNPLSYAFPTEKFPPVVIDLSCSVVPAGKLILSHKKREKIPLGWAFDKEGNPTQDPYEGFEGGGSLAPMGGHKGYALAMAVEILTAVLTGGKWSQNIKNLYEEDKTGIQGTCHTFMALDPEIFVGRIELKKNMDSYIRSIKDSAKAKYSEEILIPGERGYRTESMYSKEGIPLSSTLVSELVTLANSFKLPISFMD
jgi:LDH2 family malate/lactate/ureidoglycolate dehydrogenase